MRAGDPWRAYAPDARMPWNLERVVHLHRSAGLGAAPAEVLRDLQEGPEAALERLFTGRVREVPADFESVSAALAARAVARADALALQAWWVGRLLFGPDPLRERMALLWHDHFATSALKVRDLGLMHRQNEVLRRDGLGPFAALLEHTVKEPALLLWLDAETNRVGHPNENLARELLELFTLGIGPYDERDVKEAARALTGWVVRGGHAETRAVRHDDGEKEILGDVGPWDGDDLLRILCAHPATARRLAWRIAREFLGEDGADAEALDSLAHGLRAHRLDLGWAARTVLSSELFFRRAGAGRHVLAPAPFVVGLVRALGLADPPPSTLVLAHWLTRAGQELFFPPNVGGWPGGLSWLGPRELVARANFARALLEGAPLGRPALDPARLAADLEPLARDQRSGAVLAVLLTGRARAPESGDLGAALVSLLASPDVHLS